MHLLDPLDDALPVISVSALALYLHDLLETNDILQNIWVHGEVSNCKTYPSGHCYFTLKEGDAQLLCVFFKSSRMRTAAPTLRDGMAFAVNGRVSYYGRDGKLQFYVEEVKPLGEGAFFQQFEQLKARLAAEGLFDAERKRPLPTQPTVIGIVTSPRLPPSVIWYVYYVLVILLYRSFLLLLLCRETKLRHLLLLHLIF